MLEEFQDCRGRFSLISPGNIAFGGLTVGNLCIMLNTPDPEPLERAVELLEFDGLIVSHSVNGVKHYRLKE